MGVLGASHKSLDTPYLFLYNAEIMNVFLDLEETVINNWQEGMLVNSTRVRNWLSSLGVNGVQIFSFAVWNQIDQIRFWKEINPVLTKALDVHVRLCPTTEDMLAADLAVTGVKWENLHEFIATRGKVDAFRSWCKHHHPHEHSILLDDTVPNAVWEDFDSGLMLHFLNVKTLT